MLRSILIDAGLDAGFEPQVVIEDDEFDARVDLGHQDLRLVVEADSFEFHGTRKALVADCRRYVSLVVRGWTVLRFSWEDVMYDPDWVVECVRACVSGHTSGHNSILRAA
jgi:very-short-patch-repair endonuclease